MHSLWLRKLLSRKPLWSGAQEWKSLICCSKRSSIKIAFKVTHWGLWQGSGTWLSPFETSWFILLKGWHSYYIILVCQTERFVVQHWVLLHLKHKLRRNSCFLIAKKKKKKKNRSIYTNIRKHGGITVFVAGLNITNIFIFYSKWIIPEVVARGSSNAICLKAFLASKSLWVRPDLLHEAVDKKKGSNLD